MPSRQGGEYHEPPRIPLEGFLHTAFTNIPRIQLFQPYSSAAMQNNVSGCQDWLHRRLDYRGLIEA